MSPEGISMFYCASDVNTCLYEIYDNTKKFATIANFYNMRSITCIDFTKINILKFPSLFN